MLRPYECSVWQMPSWRYETETGLSPRNSVRPDSPRGPVSAPERPSQRIFTGRRARSVAIRLSRRSPPLGAAAAPRWSATVSSASSASSANASERIVSLSAEPPSRVRWCEDQDSRRPGKNRTTEGVSVERTQGGSDVSTHRQATRVHRSESLRRYRDNPAAGRLAAQHDRLGRRRG